MVNSGTVLLLHNVIFYILYVRPVKGSLERARKSGHRFFAKVRSNILKSITLMALDWPQSKAIVIYDTACGRPLRLR